MLALARGASQGSVHANVRRALDSSLSILRDGLQRQGIQLNVQLTDNVPNIRTAQGDLEQLFLNLAANARDAMRAGGTLSIRTELAGDKLAITIADTGCGIPPEHVARIQEPFFTTKRNGSGLGLSICRSIIWNVGGEMKIESCQGVGTQIKLVLPIVPDKATESTV